jgi:hypothetical protein
MVLFANRPMLNLLGALPVKENIFIGLELLLTKGTSMSIKDQTQLISNLECRLSLEIRPFEGTWIHFNN